MKKRISSRVFKIQTVVLLFAIVVSPVSMPLITYAEDITTSATTESASTTPTTLALQDQITSSSSTVSKDPALDSTNQSSSTLENTRNVDDATRSNATSSTNQLNNGTSSVANTSSSTKTVFDTDQSEHLAILVTQSTSSNATSTDISHGDSTIINPINGSSTVNNSLSIASTSAATTSILTQNVSTTSEIVDTIVSSTSTSSSPYFHNETVFNTVLPESTSTPLIEATTSTTTTIKTGDAYAVVNILNIANSNLINSEGSISFNTFLNTGGTFDGRSATSSSLCSPFSGCTGNDDVALNTVSTTLIENQLTIQAQTGGNVIQNASNALITSGNAYAALNLINFANVNLINCTYFISLLNAFNGFKGDIIFPSISNYFNSPFGIVGTSSISILNDAHVQNDIGVTSETDNNTNSSSTASQIKSGLSQSLTNVINNINTDIAHDNLSIYFRITGGWNGNVYGAPSWLSWQKTADGILFTSTFSSPVIPIASQASLQSLTANATSTAAIQNTASIDASTGRNQTTNTATSSIISGDAKSVASIVNIANTNVIGAHWFLALVNIFGDFNGNIKLGRPDLNIAQTQTSENTTITNGDTVSYSITTSNKGDALATNAVIKIHLDSTHTTLKAVSLPYITKPDGTIEISVGDIPILQSKTITYAVVIHNVSHSDSLSSTASVSQTETDNNELDNTITLETPVTILSVSTTSPTVSTTTATITLGTSNSLNTNNSQTSSASSPSFSSNSSNANSTLSSLTAQSVLNNKKSTVPELVNVKIIRTPQSASLNKKNVRVHEALSIVNGNTYAHHNVILEDITRDPKGTIIDTEHWDIGDIAPFEEVQLEYDAQFNDTALMGMYVLSTSIVGDDIPSQSIDNNGNIIVNITSSKTIATSSTATTTNSHKPTISKNKSIKRIRTFKNSKIILLKMSTNKNVHTIAMSNSKIQMNVRTSTTSTNINATTSNKIMQTITRVLMALGL